MNCPHCGGHVAVTTKKGRSPSGYDLFKKAYRTARLRCKNCDRRRLCRKTTSLCYYCHYEQQSTITSSLRHLSL